MKQKNILLTTVLVVLMTFFCSGRTIANKQEVRNEMVMVNDGKPLAKIVISPKANSLVIDAAKELQTYIEKMSGAKLPIVNSSNTDGNLILVGRMPAVDKLIPNLDNYDLGADGIIIRSFGDKLVITGKSDGFIGAIGRADCGTPNAVYYFLEMLGCRWYMPGDIGEVIPYKKTITVGGLDVVSKPDFLGRRTSLSSAQSAFGPDSDAYKDYRQWLIRNRTGSNQVHDGHTLKHLLPKSLGDAHPDYFALIEGKRRWDAAANICVSNPEVIETVYNNYDTLLRRQGPFRSFAVGHYDSWLWCECDGCRKMYGEKIYDYESKADAGEFGGSEEDRASYNIANGTLKFINEIAERIEKTHPGTTINYYAYYNIPGFPTVKPRDNVVPVICHLAPTDKEWRQEVQKWVRISKNLHYYTYMGHRTAFPKLGIGNDIRWCYDNKGISFTQEVSEQSPINMLPIYLSTKVLWDTKTDSNQLLAEFYRDYYGAAEKPMRLFWETFDDVTHEVVLAYDCHYSYPESVTSEVLAKLDGYLDEALCAANQSVIIRRINSLKRYMQIVEFQIASRDALDKWRQNRLHANQQAVLDAVQNTINAMKAASGEFAFFRTGLLWKRHDEVSDMLAALSGETLLEMPNQWLFSKDPNNIGEKEKWFALSADIKAFKPISINNNWESQWVGEYDGYGWYVADVVIPYTEAKHVWLLFNAVDELAKVWINGEYVGASEGDPGYLWDKPVAFEITNKYSPETKVRIAVRVHDSKEAGGIWKPVTITCTDE